MIALLALLLAVVNSPNPSITYACDGVTAAYVVNFPYQASGDLQITSTTPSGGVTTLAQTTDWTVNLASTSSTATLTLGAPATKCPSGNTLKIARNLALTQPTSFKAQTTFDSSLHERVYDRTVMQIQQVDAKVGATDIKAYVDAAINNTLTGGTVVQPLTWALTGDGSTSVFSIPNAVVSNANLYEVTVDGLVQAPITDYTVDSGTAKITFVSTPALNAKISVRSLGYARALSVLTPYQCNSAGCVSRTTAAKLGDAFSVCDFIGATCPSGGDDRAAIVAALTAASAAGGRIVYFPRGDYKVGSSFTIPDNVWLVGDGAQSSRLLRTYTGDLITAMGNYAGIERMGINLQDPTYGAGIGVHIATGTTSQRIVNSEIRNCTGACLQFEADGGTLFVSMGTSYFSNATVGTAGAIKFNGTDTGAASRSFFGTESGGCTLYDFGGANDTYVYGGFSNGLLFGTTSAHVMIAGMRIGSPPATVTIKGQSHHIMGNEFASTVTLDASTQSVYFESGVPSNNVTDSGSNNTVITQNIKTPGTLVTGAAGPNAIGGGTDADSRLRLLGSFTGVTNTIALQLTDTITVPVGGLGLGLNSSLNMNKAASGTHSMFAGIFAQPPSIGGGAATVTSASTVQITGQPSGGGTNRALWIQGGLFETAGDVLMTSTKTRGSCTLGTNCASITVQTGTICTCADTTAAAACRVALSGTTLTITGTGTDVINYHCF